MVVQKGNAVSSNALLLGASEMQTAVVFFTLYIATGAIQLAFRVLF